jgi:hypothetical protein
MYTVHGKCDRQLILRAAEYHKRVKINPISFSPGHFASLVADTTISPEHRQSILLLAGRLDQLLKKETDHGKLPTLEEFLEDRQAFSASADPLKDGVFLQSKKRNLLNEITTEFQNFLRSTSEHLVAVTLVRKLPSFWRYLVESKEQSALIDLILKHPLVAGQCLETLNDSTLQADDLMRAFYDIFRANFETKEILEGLKLHQSRLLAIGSKLEEDLAQASQAKIQLQRKVFEMTEGLVQELKSVRRRIPGILVISKFQVDELCLCLDEDMAAVARELASNYSYWFLKAEDVERLQATMAVLQSTMAELEIFNSDL